MNDIIAEAIRVLVMHQRYDIGWCMCGWDEPGKSHAEHQVSALAKAGVLKEDEDEDEG